VSQQPEPLLGLLDADAAGTALICPDADVRFSHAELAELVDGLAGKLQATGVGAGDRVAVVLPNGVELVAILFALASLGAATVPLNPAYTEPEFRFYLDDLVPQLLLIGESAVPSARAAAGSIPIAEVVTAAPGQPVDLRVGGRAVAAAGSNGAGTPEQVALLLHTSGTTSRPKQVPLLQRNLTAQARSIAAHYQLICDDVSFCVMPLFHVHGLIASTLAQLAAGGTVIVPRRFSPRRFWSQAAADSATWLSAGPTLHRMILDHAADADTRLRFARSCSSALSPQLMREAEARYGAPMVEAYGMTEATHQIASNPLPPAARYEGSVGIPAGAEFRIVDADGGDVEPGATGEVAIRGAGLTPGYLNNDQANAESFFGGWFRTGDQGRVDDGYLRLHGRLKEMIIRGGENISPYEIEAVLLAHPRVAEAVAFGVDDDKYGQTVAAAVVLEGDAGVDDLRRHAAHSLAAFKVPDRIHVLDEIPKTPTGKVQRPRMAAYLEGEG
jgi:acyl-CoA synthetase (AMP-forming)/AMP-acid ligase II